MPLSTRRATCLQRCKCAVRRFLLSIYFGLLTVISPHLAFADQNASELAPLFETLQNAQAPVAAYAAEQAIWELWMRGPNDEASNRLRLAQTAVQTGNFAHAQELFDALVADFPGFAEAWNQRAILRFILGELRGSLADIDRALELEPRHFGALSGRGECYLRLEDLPQALRAYEAAVAIHPFLDDVQAKIKALRAHYQRGA